MSRLDEALERLERAVARLEAACVGGARIEAGRRAPEAEAAQLRVAAGEIAARVDGALARIGRALGGEG
jgi:hypothetical protein